METEKEKEDAAVGEEKNTFHFSYSAEQQKEIEKIREKYVPREETLFIPGIIIGILGIAVIVSAPVLYTRITKKRREKLAPEIIRLTDELSKQQ